MSDERNRMLPTHIIQRSTWCLEDPDPSPTALISLSTWQAQCNISDAYLERRNSGRQRKLIVGTDMIWYGLTGIFCTHWTYPFQDTRGNAVVNSYRGMLVENTLLGTMFQNKLCVLGRRTAFRFTSDIAKSNASQAKLCRTVDKVNSTRQVGKRNLLRY